ncbi:hypothetical protein AAHH80_37005, partial [Burkholderia pseudomallei]
HDSSTITPYAATITATNIKRCATDDNGFLQNINHHYKTTPTHHTNPVNTTPNTNLNSRTTNHAPAASAAISNSSPTPWP